MQSPPRSGTASEIRSDCDLSKRGNVRPWTAGDYSAQRGLSSAAAKSRRAIFCHRQQLTLPVPLEMVDQYVLSLATRT